MTDHKPTTPYNLATHPEMARFFDPEISPSYGGEPQSASDEYGILFRYPGHVGGPATGKRILAIAGDETACGHYRIKYPMMTLALLGAQVEVRILKPDIPVPIEPFFKADILYVQRELNPAISAAYETMSRVQGTLVVYDLDDYLHGVHPESPAYPLYQRKVVTQEIATADGIKRKIPVNAGFTALENINRNMTCADGVLFSTRELNNLYRKNARRSHVLLNGLDLTLGDRDWDLSKPRFDWRPLAQKQGLTVDDNSLLFGISCGDTHKPDLTLIGPAIKEILSQTTNTFFGIQTSHTLAFQFCQEYRLPMDRVFFLRGTSFKNYPRPLSGFDVMLAPLLNTTFNQGKSSLRVLEFGAWGVPYIASKVAPFQRLHRETQGQGGFIVETPADWVRKTALLLTDPELRREKGQFLQGYVRSNYDIRKTYAALLYSLESFRNGKEGLIEAPSLLETSDRAHKIPINTRNPKRKDPCLCGSTKQYNLCCAPAWGKP